MKIRPTTQIGQDGATDGQALLWDATAGAWVPTTLSTTTGLADPTTTKGDLLVRGASTVDRLAVGTDGHVLTADSTATDGVVWAAPSGGGGGGTSGPVRTILKTLHATYGDDFTGASLAAKWSRGGNATSGQESFQVDPDAATPTWARWDRGASGGYLYQSAPAGDFAIVWRGTILSGGGLMCGPVITNTSGDGVGVTFYSSPDSWLVTSLSAMAYASAFVSGDTMSTTAHESGIVTWLRLRKSGTSYFGSMSLDGEKWSKETAALTSAITVARIGVGHWFGSTGVLDFDAFNVV